MEMGPYVKLTVESHCIYTALYFCLALTPILHFSSDRQLPYVDSFEDIHHRHVCELCSNCAGSEIGKTLLGNVKDKSDEILALWVLSKNFLTENYLLYGTSSR